LYCLTNHQSLITNHSSLILASASPQRKSLLQGLGLSFAVEVSQIHEDAHPESDPVRRARILAQEKALEVSQRFPDAFVIGCDTLVVAADGSLLEKARDAKEAHAMVRKLSGAVSVVHSALCVIAPGGKWHEGISSSKVRFKKLTDAEIDWWISTDLWRDRSGSFQIDGPGQMMIEHLEGDWTGVVGLPVFLLGKLLEEAGYVW